MSKAEGRELLDKISQLAGIAYQVISIQQGREAIANELSQMIAYLDKLQKSLEQQLDAVRSKPNNIKIAELEEMPCEYCCIEPSVNVVTADHTNCIWYLCKDCTEDFKNGEVWW